MTDHRALQRSLFRMQLDPGYARAVFARDASALASTGLAPADLELLLGADPRGVSADPGGRRRSQLIGNVVAEYTGAVHLAVERQGLVDVAARFPASPEFHAAIRADRALVPAFGAYVARRIAEREDPVLDSILALERAMVEARRGPREVAAPPAGCVVLAPRARLVEVRAGTFELAARLASPESSSVGSEPRSSADEGREQLLVVTRDAPHVGALHEIEVEPLSPAVGRVLLAARRPLSQREIAGLAERGGAEPAELEAFLDGLVEEGVLLRTLGKASAAPSGPIP